MINSCIKNQQHMADMQAMSNSKWLSFHILATLSFIIHQILVDCKSGFISESILQSKFYCDTSSMKVFKTTSELQCVHKCAMLDNCEILNYRVVNDQEKRNCEVYQLPHNHRSCRMIKDERKWKALVYQVSSEAAYESSKI